MDKETKKVYLLLKVSMSWCSETSHVIAAFETSSARHEYAKKIKEGMLRQGFHLINQTVNIEKE